MLNLSSKRSVHDGHLRKDMPYLEFNQMFKPIHGQHVMKPHEMSWSLDQYLERQMDIKDETDRRIETMMDERFE